MATLNQDSAIVEQVLQETADFYRRKDIQTYIISDSKHGHYLLLDEGWRDHKRIHSTWVHIELRDGKVYIHEDGTQDGVAVDLMKAGIPASRIVLSFKHPSLRQDTPFAVA